jgi:chemotaxis protein CheD
MSDVVLNPGDLYFSGRNHGVVRTLLGSCVAITLWHARLRLGGMCHYMMPGGHTGPSDHLDGRYADDAVRMFVDAVARHGTRPGEYEVGLFGGGSQFAPRPGFPPQRRGMFDVPRRNIRAGRELLERHGFHVGAEHVGGTGPRVVELDLDNGTIRLRHTDLCVGNGPQ